jgi:hypothetical protein
MQRKFTDGTRGGVALQNLVMCVGRKSQGQTARFSCRCVHGALKRAIQMLKRTHFQDSGSVSTDEVTNDGAGVQTGSFTLVCAYSRYQSASLALCHKRVPTHSRIIS